MLACYPQQKRKQLPLSWDRSKLYAKFGECFSQIWSQARSWQMISFSLRISLWSLVELDFECKHQILGNKFSQWGKISLWFLGGNFQYRWGKVEPWTPVPTMLVLRDSSYGGSFKIMFWKFMKRGERTFGFSGSRGQTTKGGYWILRGKGGVSTHGGIMMGNVLVKNKNIFT